MSNENLENEKPVREEKTQPSFYAVIPASVRYDRNLPQGAKLLYGELTALCNLKGFCWSKNGYFANLYQTSERTIINWINALKDGGYITVSYKYVSGKKEIDERHIRIAAADNPIITHKNIAPDAKTLDLQNQEAAGQPEKTEVVKKFSPRSENNFTGVVKKFSIGGENNFTDNTTANITSTTTPPFNDKNLTPGGKAAVDSPFTPDDLKQTLKKLDIRLSLPNAAALPNNPATFGDVENSSQRTTPSNCGDRTSLNLTSLTTTPPFDDKNLTPGGKAAVDSPFTPDDLKQTLKKLDIRLSFDDGFYPRAAAFMSKKGFGFKYLEWLHEKCKIKEPRDFKAYFYTVFDKDNIADEYSACKIVNSKPQEPATVSCPVCSTVHPKTDEKCPSCDLLCCAGKNDVERRKKLYSLPQNIRDEYNQKHTLILDEYSNDRDIVKVNNKLDSLDQEYGLSASA